MNIIKKFLNNEIVKKFLNKEVILYVIFGALTTLVNIASFWIFTRIIVLNHNEDLNRIIANTVAWILSVLFAYITNRIWVFDSKSKGIDMLKETVSFFSARLASLGMDMGILYLGATILKFPDMPVKIFSNVLVIIFNYVFSKFFIFKNKEDKVND